MPPAYDDELAARIVNAAYLQGRFVLRSGQVSTTYFDKYRFESDPNLLHDIAKALASLLPTDVEMLAGLELGGVPLATALSLETRLPVIFVRKAAKSYGTCKIAEGTDFKNKRICLIEDVITTGGQVLESAEALRKEGGVVDWVLNVIWRGTPDSNWLGDTTSRLQRISLFNMDDLLSTVPRV